MNTYMPERHRANAFVPKPTIELFSHHFVIRYPTEKMLEPIYRLANLYTQFHYEYDRSTRRNVYKPFKTYGIYVDKGIEFRFHIGQYADFRQACLDCRVDISDVEVIEHDVIDVENIDIKPRDNWVLRKEQEEANEFILNPYENRPLIMMPVGTGKALPLTTLVRIPRGWKKMGDLKVGDKVISRDGSETTVTGVYPQGVKSAHRLFFEDSRHTVCCEEHLWKIYRSDQDEARVITSAQLKLEMEASQDVRFYIDEAYVDRTTEGEISDEEIKSLRSIKKLPEAYFEAPANVREKIARSFFYMNKAMAKVNSVELAKDIALLFRSVGIPVRQRSNMLWYAKRKPGEPKDKLRISYVAPSPACEMQCISVDHPEKLFVIEHYIVTHNTVTALVAAAKLKKRIAVVVLATYVEKWISDCKKILDVNDSDIVKIQGANILQRATFYPTSGIAIPKIFVISLPTMVSWYKLYEENTENPVLGAYGCYPYQFFEHLQIGTVIFDEAHQHPHPVFRIHAYTHVAKTISLSATLISEEPTLKKIQMAMYPHFVRYDKIKMERYITVYACAYQIVNFENSKIKISAPGRTTYSHTTFENTLLATKRLGAQYVSMILDLLEKEYVDKYIEGDKAVVFVGTRALATLLTELATKRFSDFDVRRYVEVDPYENVIDADIRFTTIVSAGTAVDIENLRVSIMTISIDSPIANIQVLGRLRKLIDRDVKFFYLYCSTIKKHVDYHFNKKALFAERAKHINDIFLRTLYP